MCTCVCVCLCVILHCITDISPLFSFSLPTCTPSSPAYMYNHVYLLPSPPSPPSLHHLLFLANVYPLIPCLHVQSCLSPSFTSFTPFSPSPAFATCIPHYLSPPPTSGLSPHSLILTLILFLTSVPAQENPADYDNRFVSFEVPDSLAGHPALWPGVNGGGHRQMWRG